MPDYEGKVSGSQQRWESDGSGQVLVWDFRIERHDPSGQPLPRVPVEMRGQGFNGAISDGDEVRVRGAWAPGETLNVGEVVNLTTGARVTARRRSGQPPQIIMTVIGLLVMLGLIVYVFRTFLRF